MHHRIGAWLVIGGGILCASHVTASAQDPTVGHAYYHLYEAGYEPGNYQDDWFYDYFAIGERGRAHAYGYADYDHARARFPWEDGASSPPLPPSGDPPAEAGRSAPVPPVCMEHEAERHRRMNTIRTVRGRVVRTKTLSVRDVVTEGLEAHEGTDLHNVVAMVAPDEGSMRLVVDMGPMEGLGPHALRPGQRIIAAGVVRRVGERQVLVAERIILADEERRVERRAQIRMAIRALAGGGGPQVHEAPPTGEGPSPAKPEAADGSSTEAHAPSPEPPRGEEPPEPWTGDDTPGPEEEAGPDGDAEAERDVPPEGNAESEGDVHSGVDTHPES
jgi:hypothetical protein